MSGGAAQRRTSEPWSVVGTVVQSYKRHVRAETERKDNYPGPYTVTGYSCTNSRTAVDCTL